MKHFKNFLSVTIICVMVFLFQSAFAQDKSEERIVLIKTEFGNMKVKLYNETPFHRDNFLKLTQEGYYNDLLFHRVIKEFMIQGGDPDSRGAAPNKRLGAGGPNYQLPAEIMPKFFHKKGALSAARQGDNVNPEKKSSGSQFYIVQGKVWDENSLQQFEDNRKFQMLRKEAMAIYNGKQALVQRLQSEGKTDSINVIKEEIQQAAEKIVNEKCTQINTDKKAVYSTLGGTPHLDGEYTVFGEVFEGLEVIDSIANLQTAPGDRPLKDVKMTIEIIK